MSQTIDYPTVVLPTSASTSDLPQQPPPRQPPPLNTPSRSSSRSSLNHNTHTSLSPPMLPFITTSLSAPGPSTSANTYANAHASLNGSRATSLRARSSMMGFGNIDSARTSVTHVAPYDETMFLQAQEPDFGLEGGAEPESEILQVDARARPASGVDGSSAFTPTPPTPHRDADAASPVLPGAGPSSQLGAHDHDQSMSSLLPTPRPPQIVTSYSSSPSSLPSSSQQESTHPHVQSPQTTLTFLLITGQRKIMSFDPETTVGRVKELVWNAWPSDWEQHPPAPSYLRILYLGKLLQDEDTLIKLKIPTTNTPPSSPTRSSPTSPPTIVHLSIKPFGAPNDGGDYLLKKKWGRQRSGDTGGYEIWSTFSLFWSYPPFPLL